MIPTDYDTITYAAIALQCKAEQMGMMEPKPWRALTYGERQGLRDLAGAVIDAVNEAHEEMPAIKAYHMDQGGPW